MNFDMAAEMLEEDEGITVRTVRVTDDVAAMPPGAPMTAAASPATST